MHRTVALSLALGLLSGLAPSARAESPPDVGHPWEPRRLSRPLYAIRPPTDDNGQRRYVEAADGVEIWTETWLPVQKEGGPRPPKRLPTIVFMSPYLFPGDYGRGPNLMPVVVPRGYAWTVAHVRGTGKSGGCRVMNGPEDADDGARVVQYVGRDAPWASGRVGMFGLSYTGGIALNVAARGPRSMTRHLRATVSIAPLTNMYEGQFRIDGVPSFVSSDAIALNLIESFAHSGTATVTKSHERPGCQAEHVLGTSDPDDDLNAYFEARDLRRWVRSLRTPTFLAQGYPDVNPGGVPPISQVGLFERLPRSTPKFGLFGWFGHTYLNDPNAYVRPEWHRADWFPMVLAWLDHHVRGRRDTGVERWPTVQMQGSDGGWRAERDWPFTGGPVGHLALGPAGALGARRPAGSTTYREGGFETTRGNVPETYAVFETAALRERMQLTGQPVLDLWVELDRPDAHIAARIDVLDASGDVIPHANAHGMRSARHLDPLVANRFVQAEGRPAPVGEPVRMAVRFQPTDLVVPKGGRLRLTVAGSVIVSNGLESQGIPEPLFRGPTEPSGALTTVTVLHDCARPSALRFLMPRERPRLLNVRETDEKGPLRAVRAPIPVSDGGGIATAPVCGERPLRLPMFGHPAH